MERFNTSLVEWIAIMVAAGMMNFACGPLYPSIPKSMLKPVPASEVGNQKAQAGSVEQVSFDDLLGIALSADIAKEWLTEKSLSALSTVNRSEAAPDPRFLKKQYFALLQTLPPKIQTRLQNQIAEYPSEVAWTESVEHVLKRIAALCDDALLCLGQTFTDTDPI